MPLTPVSQFAPAQSLPVYSSADFIVVDGANLDDPLSFAAELLLDDVYELKYLREPKRLTLHPVSATKFIISDDSVIGASGASLHLDSALTFMSPDGQTTDAIILVEVDSNGNINEIYLLPLAPLNPRTNYNLVGINTDTAAQVFAQVACVSFSRGTHITMASGEQRLIEDLKVGDRVLTRDDGAQKVRWIGESTLRAVGDFAPICIKAGTLNNYNDLVVNPDHRLFIYQRSDQLGAGRAELLIKARHLLNDDSVARQEGGFVDYFQLLFDNHQIIYAEGIAAESMLVDTRTKSVLPADLAEELGDALSGHATRHHDDLDVQETLLNRPDIAEILRRASS
jgi:hypothetical protein